jgi:Uma2 family endonuclease
MLVLFKIFKEMVKYSHIDIPLSTAAETAVKYSSRKIWTLEAYLDAEELSVEKHEFHNGKRITMAGGTPPHSEISSNFGTVVNMALYNKNDENFHVYNSDMKVFIPKTNKAVYPDLSIVNGEPILTYKHTILNPLLLVEVLSDSTEAYDRGDKFENYKSLASFKEYVLVAQNEPLVEVYYRQNSEGSEWQYTRIEGLEALVELRSIGCILKMKDIYRRVFK